MSLSNYAEAKLLDHVLGVAAFTQPTIYVALSTADPLDDGSGLAEPVGGSYARKAYSGWSAAANRAIKNGSSIEFVEATGNWGSLTHYAIFDASSGGNMLAYGAFTSPRTILSGDTARFLTDQLTFQFNAGGASNHLANKLLDHLFNVAAFTQPTVYIGLSTANPTDNGSGLAEPAGGSYARVAVAAWDATASGASANTNAIDFPDATSSWGLISHWVLFDAATNGNQLIYAALTTPKTIGNGDTARFNAGQAVITID